MCVYKLIFSLKALSYF